MSTHIDPEGALIVMPEKLHFHAQNPIACCCGRSGMTPAYSTDTLHRVIHTPERCGMEEDICYYVGFRPSAAVFPVRAA